MQGAIMHCGAESILLPQLMALPTPPQTKTHFPIPHHHFYELAESRLLQQGYTISNPRHYINREGAHYFALMQILHADEDQNADQATMCALRNTHDRTFAAKLAVGAKVFVCDNLSFSGDIVVGRKHTANIWNDLPDLIEGAIGRIRVMRKRQDIRFAEYRRAPLDDFTADHLMMETYRKGIINLKRIKAVNDQWYLPLEGDEQPNNTVWDFFNACTASLRPNTTNQLMELPKRTIDLHLLLDEFCDVDLPSEEKLQSTEEEDDLSVWNRTRKIISQKFH